MEEIILNAEERLVPTQSINELRKAGKIPAVLYGHKVKNQNLMLNRKEIDKVFAQAGETSLVTLQLAGQKPIKVIIQDMQFDPEKHLIKHVDLHQISMTERIKVEVPLKLIGESEAVKNHNGMIVESLDKLEIECLPNDLLHEIEVDLGVLKNLHDHVKVKDLQLPAKVQVLTDPELVIVTVTPIKVQVEEKPAVVAEAQPEDEAAKVEASVNEAPVKEGHQEKK